MMPRFLLSFVFILGLSSCLVQTYNSVSNDDRRYAQPVLDSRSVWFQKSSAVLRLQCSGCHKDFATMSEEQWVSSRRVVPGSPETSPMFSRVRGSQVGGQENMPPATSLSREEIQVLRDWIINLGIAPLPPPFPPPLPPIDLPNAAKRTKLALEVMQQRCNLCHKQERTAKSETFGGKIVEPFALFTTDEEFVSAGLVVRGNALDSWFYRSMIGYGDIDSMPLKGTMIPKSEGALLLDWIDKMGQP